MCAHQVVRPPLHEPFFPEVTARSTLDDRERATVEAVRGLLAGLAPSAVRPERTKALRTPTGAVELRILHAFDDTRLALELEHGQAALSWIGGQVRAPWGPELERALAALLMGRNELTMLLRFGQVHTVETAVWDAEGERPRLLHRRLVHGATAAACRRLPGGAATERMSVSFDRPEGLGAPAEDAPPTAGLRPAR
jgi:hypothetical protein